jgi:hypothetical protein
MPPQSSPVESKGAIAHGRCRRLQCLRAHQIPLPHFYGPPISLLQRPTRPGRRRPDEGDLWRWRPPRRQRHSTARSPSTMGMLSDSPSPLVVLLLHCARKKKKVSRSMPWSHSCPWQCIQCVCRNAK